jgi:hypothetical protein
MAGDPNSTSTRWLTFALTLVWFRQRHPGTTDEWAWEELQKEVLKAFCGASEGAPIDKFRYPRSGRMIDLIVLLQGNHLTFADIRWQSVECNLDWLERDWPAPTPASPPAQPNESAAAGPAPAPVVDEVPLEDEDESEASPAGKRRERQQPSRPYVIEALQALYLPNGVPPANVSNSQLFAAVRDWMEDTILRKICPRNGVPSDPEARKQAVLKHLKGCGVNWPISMTTVLRASGRRKDKSRQR